MVALSEEGARHPVPISRELPQGVAALAYRVAEVGEALVLVGAVARIVPADVVEELVACGQLDLAEALVGLHASRQFDRVAVRIEATTAARLEARDATALAERANVRGEATERAARELIARCDVDVVPLCPPLLATVHVACGLTLLSG